MNKPCTPLNKLDIDSAKNLRPRGRFFLLGSAGGASPAPTVLDRDSVQHSLTRGRIVIGPDSTTRAIPVVVGAIHESPAEGLAYLYMYPPCAFLFGRLFPFHRKEKVAKKTCFQLLPLFATHSPGVAEFAL